jgi:hypothetical protein
VVVVDVVDVVVVEVVVVLVVEVLVVVVLVVVLVVVVVGGVEQGQGSCENALVNVTAISGVDVDVILYQVI